MFHNHAIVVHVTINGETIQTTPEHPFYVVVETPWLPLVESGRWVNAGELRVGDRVRKAEGASGVVSEVSVVVDAEVMYNLTVDQAHTFFVGDQQWLVHNKMDCPGRAQSNPSKGRYDNEHFGNRGYDTALDQARKNAGDLGENTQKMYDPETGTLIGEMSADGKQGWRIDEDHVNYWDWSSGKKGAGGKYGHEFFPPEQAGPHSEHIGYAPWE